MQSKISKLPKSSVELSVSVSASEMAEFFNKALKEVQKDFALEGFRKGNVPEDLILKNTGRQYIEAQSLDIAVQESYVSALKEHKLNPVAQPKIDIKKFVVVGANGRSPVPVADEIALEYIAQLDVLPEVEIRDYKNIRIKKDPKALEVSESEVEKVFDHLRKQRAKLEPIDRPLKKDDWAEINFEGSLEGVARDDMKSNNYPIILGESQMIPGFEEQLIGLKKGESKKFPITFPKDYHQEDFRKKRAEFQVTIIDSKERIIPEIDDKFVKDLGHEKVEELSAAIKDSLKQEKETVAHTKLENDILDEILKRTRIDLPDSLVEQEVNRMLNESKDRLVKINFDWSRYLDQIKKSEEDLKKEMRPTAEKNIKIGLILGKIAIAEGVDPSAKDGAHKVMERLVEYSTK